MPHNFDPDNFDRGSPDLPLNNPKATECVLFAICFPDHSEAIILHYVRSGERIVFANEPQEIPNVLRGRIASLFPKNL